MGAFLGELAVCPVRTTQDELRTTGDASPLRHGRIAGGAFVLCAQGESMQAEAGKAMKRVVPATCPTSLSVVPL